MISVYTDVCKLLLKRPLKFVDLSSDSVVDEMEFSLSAHDVREILHGLVLK